MEKYKIYEDEQYVCYDVSDLFYSDLRQYVESMVSQRSDVYFDEQVWERVQNIYTYYRDNMGPLLGYTGRASSEELESLKKENPDYSNDAIVGKAGIEQYMELELQGKDGQETVTVDNLGKVLKIDDNTTVEPVAGNDVYLSVDADWQSAIYQILKQRVAGILLNKIEAVKEYDYKGENDASRIIIPIYDVYNALISNSVIDID